MTRNLKALGLSLVALFALGAIATSSASATSFTAAEYPATIMAEQVAGEEHKMIFAEGNKAELTCETVTFDSPAGYSLSAASESARGTPNYQGCHAMIAGVTKDVTITHNGCWLEITISSELHLKCPEGVKGLELHIYNNAADHTPPTDKPLCTYTMKPQTISGVTMSNMTGTPNDTTMKLNSTVSITRTSGSALACGPETQTGSYTGNTTARATNKAEQTINSDIG